MQLSRYAVAGGVSTLVNAFYAVYSSAILLALHAVVASPTPLLESGTVAVASVLGGAGRFLLLRLWVLRAAFTPAAVRRWC